MGDVWFTSCAAAEYPRLLGEIRGRDASARLLRFGDAGALIELAESFPAGAAGAALTMGPRGIDACEEAVGRLARTVGAGQIMVLAHEVDAAAAARLFAAGATEVIAAEGSGSPSRPLEVDAERVTGEGVLPTQDGARADPGSSVRDDDPRLVGEASPKPAEGVETPAADLVPPVNAAPTSDPAPPVRAAPTSDPAPPANVAPTSGPAPAQPRSVRRAPLVAVISGRGGVGKSVIVAAMATAAARLGLRAAVLDLDLMFGNLHEMLGAESLVDLGILVPQDEHGEGVPAASDELIEASAMRIGPGLTLWGPLARPERAELMGPACERLIEVLRGIADVVFVDTSVFWGDAMAAAVSSCDRCLVVGDGAPASAPAAARAVELAVRLGVPQTRMTCVFNRFGARGHGEEQAMRFEMGVPLRSRTRIADGGDDLTAMLAFGRMGDVVSGQGAFARSVREATRSMLLELGCAVDRWDAEEPEGSAPPRRRIRLPWNKGAGGAS